MSAVKTKDSTAVFSGRTIGWDPGTVNCAWAVWNGSSKELEDHGVEEGVHKDVNEFYHFATRVYRVLTRFHPDKCTIERYQLRGGKGFVGNMECVNIEIGIIMMCCFFLDIECRLVTASTHKTYAKRNWEAKKGKDGKLSMKTCPEWNHLPTEHEADAANIAKYGAYKFFNNQEK